MAVSLGMNGFGRIGRYLTRLLMDEPELELKAINARSDNETYAHLLKYDLVCELENQANPEELNAVFKGAGSEILGYSEEPLVSVDFLGDSHGAVVDGLSTSVMNGTMAKVLAW